MKNLGMGFAHQPQENLSSIRQSPSFNWIVELPPFMEKVTEYALGAAKGKDGKIGYFNILLNITHDCDCVPWSDAPFVPDIGIMASKDPVAIDHASFDLANRQIGLTNSRVCGRTLKV